MRRLHLALAVLFALSAAAPAHAGDQPEKHWVGTWAAAPQQPLSGTLANYREQTLRLIIHTSLGGPQARIRISNLFGTVPLRIGGAHIARRASGSDIDAGSDRSLTFGGNAGVTIPARSSVMSDPVELEVPALSDLAISLYLPGRSRASTTHILAMQTSYATAGDETASAHFPAAKTIDAWPFLTGVDIATSAHGAAIVAFGDSIVDGDGSTADADHRWPDMLAARLQHGTGASPETGVLNQGMIGNRLLRASPQQAGSPIGPGFGPAALDRFERDVMAQAGVRAVILRLGINDIGLPGSVAPAADRVTAPNMIAGYRRLIARARQNNVRIVGTTLSPFEQAQIAPGYYSARKEAVRQTVNAWIRGGGEFDAVVDFDQVLRDPKHPGRLRPGYDSGDHLHPNDAGYAAMADAIPLASIGLD